MLCCHVCYPLINRRRPRSELWTQCCPLVNVFLILRTKHKALRSTWAVMFGMHVHIYIRDAWLFLWLSWCVFCVFKAHCWCGKYFPLSRLKPWVRIRAVDGVNHSEWFLRYTWFISSCSDTDYNSKFTCYSRLWMCLFFLLLAPKKEHEHQVV